MRDYSLGKIYKIVNSENDKIYIGSTTMKYLCERMSGHRKDARDVIDKRSSCLYKAMRKVGVDKFKIKLIKGYPCSTKKELEKEEFRVIQKFIKKEITLYNTVIDHGVIPASVGILLSKFKALLQRGCVRFEKSQNKWRFHWQSAPGKRKTKSFSVNKYGDSEAKALAIAFQDQTYPKI